MEIRWRTQSTWQETANLSGLTPTGMLLGSLFSDPGSILRQRIIPLYKSFESRPNSSKSSSLLCCDPVWYPMVYFASSFHLIRSNKQISSENSWPFPPLQNRLRLRRWRQIFPDTRVLTSCNIHSQHSVKIVKLAYVPYVSWVSAIVLSQQWCKLLDVSWVKPKPFGQHHSSCWHQQIPAASFFMVTSKSVQRPRSVTTKPSACPITNFALAAEEAADPPWHGTRLPDRVTQCHICHYVSYFFNMCFWSLIRHDKFARLSDAYLFLCSRPSWQMKACKSTTTFKPPDLLVAASCKETPIKWTELYIYLHTLKIQTRQKTDAIRFNRSMESAAMSTNQDALDVLHTMMKNR